MKKISLKLHREVIAAIATLCRAHGENKVGDSIFDLWFRETCTELLLKFAKLRHRTAKNITVNFALEEIIVIRELNDLQRKINATGYEVLIIDNYVVNPVTQSLTV